MHSKLVVKNKRNDKGTIERLKAQFVVYGIEEEGSYKIRFSPVLDFKPIKVVIFLATQRY